MLRAARDAGVLHRGDALAATVTRSEMDVLYLGNFVVERAAKRKIVEDSRFVLRHEGDSVVAVVS